MKNTIKQNKKIFIGGGIIVAYFISLFFIHPINVKKSRNEALDNLAAIFSISTDTPAELGQKSKSSNCQINGPYPDPACTPGAVFASATADDICQSGYSKTVRNVSASLKKKVYVEYGIKYPQPTGSYEADHFIPLEIGGSNDIANLFPEAAAPVPGFHEKDLVEDYLHEEICAGRTGISQAQMLIATDWVKVYQSIPPDELAILKQKYKSWAK